MLLDVRADHLKILQDILSKYVPEREVWAFGSRAKWLAKEYSDLDLCIVGETPLSFRTLGLLEEAFDDSDLPYKVDVVDWATTSESFRKIIERDRVVVQKVGRGQDIRSDWPIVRLGDHVDACLGKMLDAKKNRGTFQLYLGNSNVRWGIFNLNDLALMRFEPHEEERYGLKDGDLVVCEGGEPGRCAIWRNAIPGMKIQKALHRVRSKEGLDTQYLFYWFMQAGNAGALEPYYTGTTIKHLTGKALSELKIPLPPIEKQRSIGKVLSSLDAKIDLNRRINQTLEAMAQALFKSWFVDFDPVKARIAAIQEGRDPLRAAMSAISGKPDAELDALKTQHNVGWVSPERSGGRNPTNGIEVASSPESLGYGYRQPTPEAPSAYDQLAATAALFPDEMEESVLGEIPRGWNAKPLDSIANYLNGLALQKFPPKSASDFLPVIKIAQLRAGHTEGADKAASDLKSEYIVCDGDVLFSWSGSLEVDVWTGRRGALNQHLFKVTSSVVPKWFYLLATKHYLPQFREIAANKATTMGHIQRKHLSDARIATPSSEFFYQATKVASPLLDEIISLRLQSRELAKARDTLLPKLLSGELPVTGAITKSGA